jgi:hypothetical protein
MRHSQNLLNFVLCSSPLPAVSNGHEKEGVIVSFFVGECSLLCGSNQALIHVEKSDFDSTPYPVGVRSSINTLSSKVSWKKQSRKGQ